MPYSMKKELDKLDTGWKREILNGYSFYFEKGDAMLIFSSANEAKLCLCGLKATINTEKNVGNMVSRIANCMQQADEILDSLSKGKS